MRSLQIHLALRWEEARREIHIHVPAVRRSSSLLLILFQHHLSSGCVLLQRGVGGRGEDGGRGREGVGGGQWGRGEGRLRGLRP